MIYIALGSSVAYLVTIVLLLRVFSNLTRQAARERDLLVNQLCNLAGRPWTPAPADDWAPPADVDEPDRYVTSASQMPEEF